MHRPKIKREWIRVCLGRKKLRKTSTVGTAISNRNIFSPFVLSVYGELGKKAQVVLATLSQLMAAKMEEPILHVNGWVSSQIVIAVAKLYYQMLRRARVPSPL